MKTNLLILILLLLTLGITSTKAQTIVDNKVYLNRTGYIKLIKMKRFKKMYDVTYSNYNKNRKYVWDWSKTIIEDPYLDSTYTKVKPMTLINLKCLQDYDAIVFRYKLVIKNPSKYKPFWNGWCLRYVRDAYPDIKNIKY
jgi:hypothetical protein